MKTALDVITAHLAGTPRSSHEELAQAVLTQCNNATPGNFRGITMHALEDGLRLKQIRKSRNSFSLITRPKK